MQCDITIELKVDFADKGKLVPLKQLAAKVGRYLEANAALLSDGVKPRVVVVCDDHYTGHEEISLLENITQQGIDLLGGEGEEGVSAELLAALKQDEADAAD